MSDGNLLTAATLFQRAARFGVRSALITAKQKSVPLFRLGTTLAVGSQDPPTSFKGFFEQALGLIRAVQPIQRSSQIVKCHKRARVIPAQRATAAFEHFSSDRFAFGVAASCVVEVVEIVQ